MATQPEITEEVKPVEPEKDEATGKFVYSYQPRDSEGQFIGKPYRFLYTDHQDLIRQITEAKEHGDRYIHEVKTGKRQVSGIPAEARHEYKPAPESTEESEKKERERFRQIAEKEFGAPIDDVRERLRKSRESDERTEAMNWAVNKQADGYYPSKENAKMIGDYLFEHKLKACPSNYDLAFEELKEKLIPVPKEQVPADSTQQRAEPTKEEAKPRSTGMIPGQFQGTRPGARSGQPNMSRERFRQIDKMSRDVWVKFQRTNPEESKTFLSLKYPAQPQQ